TEDDFVFNLLATFGNVFQRCNFRFQRDRRLEICYRCGCFFLLRVAYLDRELLDVFVSGNTLAWIGRIVAGESSIDRKGLQRIQPVGRWFRGMPNETRPGRRFCLPILTQGPYWRPGAA